MNISNPPNKVKKKKIESNLNKRVIDELPNPSNN